MNSADCRPGSTVEDVARATAQLIASSAVDTGDDHTQLALDDLLTELEARLHALASAR